MGGGEEQSDLGLAVVPVHPAERIGAFSAMTDPNSWESQVVALVGDRSPGAVNPRHDSPMVPYLRRLGNLSGRGSVNWLGESLANR